MEEGCVAGQSGGARLYRSHLWLSGLIGTTFSCRGIVAFGGDILL